MRKLILVILNKVVWQKFVWLTQSMNVWVYQGDADETVSGRSWRLRNHDCWGFWWGHQRKLVDWFALTFFSQKDHCKKAYEAEFAKRDMLR